MTTPPDESSLNRIQLRALAFSGVCHAAATVSAIANGRLSDPPDFLIGAIFTQELADIGDVFRPLENFRPAMGTAADLLSSKLRSPEQARYVAQLLKLATLLRRDRAMVEKLRNLLDASATNSPEDRVRISADIYRDTISKLGQRIQVTGSPDVLQHTTSAERIRCSLLAGIRFAWMWQQLGGKQWHLLLQRGPMLKVLGELSVA
ncbi:MAG: lysogenization regulator HflD [Gammaproteobacteria bacterium]|nr:lysogenization regulator HflD [Gammaproteobacteria bacterium]